MPAMPHALHQGFCLDAHATAMEQVREDLQLLITGDVVERDASALQKLVIRIDAREPRKFGGVERGCEHRWRRRQSCMKLWGVPAAESAMT